MAELPIVNCMSTFEASLLPYLPYMALTGMTLTAISLVSTEPLLEDSSSLPLSSTYDNGPMQRFNQAFALQTNATRNSHGLPPIPSSVNSSSAKLPPPSVFAHQTPARTPATESTPAPSSLPSQHQFPRPPQSTQAAQRSSPNSQEPVDTVGYRPSSGTSTSGSTTSRTHTSLPLNGTKQSTSRSPEEFHYVSTVADPQARLSASHPHSYANGHPSSSASGRPATAGAGVSVKSFHLSANGDQNTANGRDRSHSFPHPVPAHLKDYVLPLPPLMGSTPTSPVPSAVKGVNEDEHEPERFLEGTSKMRDSNALQLKEHRRPPNAHPESSAFGESEPVYKPQTQGLPYPSSSAYLPFSYSAHYPSRWSPLHSSLQSHHLRTNPVATVSKHVKQESEEASPKIDELSSSSATFERSEMTDATSETDARDTISRTSPPSTAGTSLSSSLHPSYTHGSKVDTPGSNPNLVGPAYLHSNNMLPPILGCRALPDTLLPWKALLSQAGIPDLETLKAEIPFEAVKRYVDCLAESWPDVLPTFTKRFQLRYAIEDALTRACRDTPTKIPQY